MNRNIANNFFHYRTNFVEIKDQIFNKFKKLLFDPFLNYFSSFRGKKSVYEKSSSITRNFILKKLMIQFQENTQRTGRSYFVGRFQLPLEFQ